MLQWFKPKARVAETQESPIVENFTDPDPIYRYFSAMTGIHFDQKESIITPKLIHFAKESECFSFEGLYEKLQRDQKCKEALINLLTVNETYFFREMGQIEFLGRCLKNNPSPQRILCAPGSSGEEPYSIAIYLAELGVNLSKMEIVSIDINTEVISKGEKGIYPERSLYRLSPELRERYFIFDSNGYRVCDRIQQCVQFRSCNLFESAFNELGLFDVIFSRNMLIYFDKETILRAVDQLRRVARSENTLFFFGHADIVTQISTLYEHYVEGVKYYTISPFTFTEKNINDTIRS